ncbi:MAG: hypothetical protein OEW99_09150 [Gammaproteobacteria bacterium]|nr:hypothetical protein [Gammaproteobacteria bacterium]MDH5659924.1 hypothetical protein [Gammaproteobacteria bacterium]
MIDSKELKFIKLLFVVAALWNLTGAGFGYFNTSYTFQNLFDRELSDPLFYDIYKGAWGTTFVYFFGYLIVAYNPLKHTGIVIVGAIGKVGFAIKLLQLYLSGIANSVVLIVIIGDLIFMLLFVYYFLLLYKAKESII